MIPDIRRWRRWTWLLLAWTFAVLGLALLVTTSIGGACSGFEGLGLDICAAGVTAGTAILWVLLLAIWVIGFLVLAIPWFARRPARRLCPPYGHPVDQGETSCRACGYDFLQGGRATAEQRTPGPVAVDASADEPDA
jgi:hypothetical protein